MYDGTVQNVIDAINDDCVEVKAYRQWYKLPERDKYEIHQYQFVLKYSNNPDTFVIVKITGSSPNDKELHRIKDHVSTWQGDYHMDEDMMLYTRTK